MSFQVRSKSSKLILKISITAMFLAFAVVSKLTLSINLPMFGAGGMKVGLAGVFTAFPAFMFGPIYGGCTSALSDILGYVVKPDGAYIPWLTITAFLGGCIKGLLWKFIFSKESKNPNMPRIIVSVILIAVGLFGVGTQLSLINDGIINGFAAVQKELPSRGAIHSMKISPLSEIAVEFAKYNNDTITLSKVTSDNDEIVVPAYVNIDGYETKITKIAESAFSECVNLKTVYIPSTVKTIDEKAFEGLENVTVEEAKAASEDDINTEEATPVLTLDNMTYGEFTFKSSDTFRKYLAGYINFVTVGLELVMAAGLVFVFVDYIIARSSKKNYNFLRIFITIFTSGLVVTTINTEILKYFLAAWNGREFMILWVPRAVEEMIVCLIQAYIISILYGVFKSKIAGKGRFSEITA